MNPALWLLIWSSQRQQREATGGPVEPPPVWEIYAAVIFAVVVIAMAVWCTRC